MDRKQTVIILLLVAAFAIFVQGLKSMRHNRFQAAEHATLALGDIDDTPYHVSNEEMDEERARSNARGRGAGGLKLAGGPSTVSQFNQYDFGGAKVVAENAKGKETIKKKKKKKKSARGKTDDKKNILADTRPYYAEKPKTPIQDSLNGDGGTTTTTVANAGGAKNNTIPMTYQEWAQLILPAPSPKNVQMLVEYYKSGMVSAEIFYNILDALIAERNPQQQHLAVSAAGEAPSAQSFNFLVQVEKAPPSAQLGSQAQTELNSYEALGTVGLLRTVMTTYLTDAATIQIATAVLQSSVTMYIANRAPAAAGSTGSTGTTTGATAATTSATTHAALARAYTGFPIVLEQVINTYKGNATIANAAQQSLMLINTIVPVVSH